MTPTFATDRSSHPKKGFNPQRIVLSNGLVVLVTENPTADIVAARLLIDAGSRYELPHHSGLSQLVAALLSKGTQSHTAQEIAVQVESLGASLSVSSAPDYCLVNLKTISADFATVLRLAADLIQCPTFPEAELALERKLTLQAIRARQEQPMAIALQQLRQAMYPQHPYGQPGLGTLETVLRMNPADLFQFHHQHFRPDTAVLSIAGNITTEETIALVEVVFRTWSIPTTPPPKPLFLTGDNAPVQVVQVQKTQQSIVMLGYHAPAVQDGDYPALKLLYAYLCSGLSSRLFTELREQRGLAYEVSGLYPTRLHPSHFVTYLGTAAENTVLALSLLNAELQRLSTEPLSQEAVWSTQRKVLGQYALGKQTNHQIAYLYGLYEFLQLGAAYDQHFIQQIQALTPSQLHQAAIQHLSQPFVSIVGPETAIAALMP